MVGLLGQRDELLRLIEAEFAVQILVRGNEINITGPRVEDERVGRLFEEMVVLLEQGHELDDPDAHILDRFATSLQRERQDFNGRMLTIRRSDLRVLASCMGRSLEELAARLEQLGLRAVASAG